jgi:hypothetical protein
MKGSSQPAGYTNVTNPAQVAQQPYLNYGWGEAKNLYQNNPQSYYPGQTLAPYMQPNPAQQQGYQALYNAGAGNVMAGLEPQANALFGQAAGGGMSGAANPANPYYQGYAQGTSPISQNFQGLQQGAQQGGQQYSQAVGQYAPQQAGMGSQAWTGGQNYANAIGSYAYPIEGYANLAANNNNLGLSQLGRTASGEYLNSNPYLNAAIETAQRPTQTAYQTSIAPGLDAAAAQSGRYGSGAQAGMASTAQQNLARGLGDISTNMSNANYARERQAQDAAAQNYGQLYNSGLGLGMQGLQNAAGLLNQAGGMYMAGADRAQTGLQNAAATQAAAGGQFWRGQDAAQAAANQYGAANKYGIAGLGSGFNQGNQNALEAMRQYPQLAQAQLIGPNAQIQAGQGLTGLDQTYRNFLQQQIDDERARFQGNQMAPYNTLNAYMQSIGSPVGGSGSTSTPYYRNQGAEIMSGLTGIAGLGRTLFGGAGMGLGFI